MATMNFHLFTYFSSESYVTPLRELVQVFGSTSNQKQSFGYNKTPKEFLAAFEKGIFACLENLLQGKPRPLATVISLGEGNHQKFSIEIDGVYSPEIARLSKLKSLTEEQEEILASLKLSQQSYEGPHGFSSSQPGQLLIKEQGGLTISFEGYVPSSLLRQAFEVEEAIIKILIMLQPDYAFVANEEDYELWHMGDIQFFPPVEPWKYYWNTMFFGADLSQRIGRSKLLNSPGHKSIELGKGIYLRPLDYLIHQRESKVDKFERKEQASALAKYLDLKFPYSTYLE